MKKDIEIYIEKRIDYLMKNFEIMENSMLKLTYKEMEGQLKELSIMTDLISSSKKRNIIKDIEIFIKDIRYAIEDIENGNI